MLLSVIYTIVIFPIVQIIELCYLFFYRIFSNHGMAIFGVSLAVSLFTLPLYFLAEKHQQNERDIQKKLKPRINKIKAVFTGDEQYMILSTYYRQNHYHPVFALRSSFGLLIQIPFFIAAFSCLTNMEILKGTSFLFINDLGAPDKMLSLRNIHINILPLLMTLINLIAAFVYSRGLEIKDKIQLYGISLVFLLILYNSPSGLICYWTMNNIFSLVKNIIQKTKNPGRIVFCTLIPVILILNIFLLFFHSGDLPNRLLAVFLVSSTLFLPLGIKLVKLLYRYSPVKIKTMDYKLSPFFYIFSCVILFLLNGYIVPSSLIASAVEEFSFIGSRTRPFPFIGKTITQGAGFFLFWPFLIYFLFGRRIRFFLTNAMLILAGISLVNVFLITENFGFFTPTMTFSEPKPFALIPGAYMVNTIFVLLALVFLLSVSLLNKTRIILSFQIITLVALLGYGVINSIKINNNFNAVSKNHESHGFSAETTTPQYAFSKNGKNVLLILLDCAIGSFVPHIFEEKPELESIIQGFTLYPNCVSFASHTLIGALPIYGGYEYTPIVVNSRDKIPLLDKQREAYLLLPLIFLDAGFSVTVTDPPFDNFAMSNLSIFDDHPEIDAKNLIGKYTIPWMRENQDIETVDIQQLLDNNLIRFSFFKSAPLFLRLFIYDRGRWLTLTSGRKDRLRDTTLNDYAFLDTLDKVTTIIETGDTFTAIYSHLPHDVAFLQAPEYIPARNVTNRGSGIHANNAHFHVMTASFLLIGKWLEYLKTNDVYDNTRIIIVSDHGRGSGDIPENITLLNGDSVLTYNSLLMVKDFNARGMLKRDGSFMTNADTPLQTLEGIIENPVNPFTGIPLTSDKDSGITLTTIGAVSTYRHNKYTYGIAKNQWLFVQDNIFKPENWKAVIEQF